MRKETMVVFAGALVALLLVAGCAPQQGGGNGGAGGGGGDETDTIPAAGVSGIIRDWSESTHAVPVTFAAEETNCVLCHDGRAFSMGTTDPASFDASSPFGPFVVATDCRACHTGNGVDLLRSGTVTTPSSPTSISAGAGALCVGCHRDRRKPDITDTERFAPHYSAQAPVYFAYGGIRQAGVDYGSTTSHAGVKARCVGCHMTEKDGVASHTFRPDVRTCKECHQGIDTFNTEAKADYDGNGTTEGIQDEVGGLLSIVNSATASAMNADTLTTEAGRIVFKRGDTTVTADIPDRVYQAAFNWALIDFDRSLGVHNPQFTVDLLQQSYLQLTGEAIPNAEPFPGSKVGTAAPGGATETPAPGGGAGGATGTPGETGTGGATGTP